MARHKLYEMDQKDLVIKYLYVDPELHTTFKRGCILRDLSMTTLFNVLMAECITHWQKSDGKALPTKADLASWLRLADRAELPEHLRM